MSTNAEPAWMVKADRGTVWVVTIGALVVAAFIFAAFIGSLVSQLSSGERSFVVLTEASAPVDLLPQGDGVVSATVTHIEATATGLSPGVFAAFIAGDAVSALTGIIVALALSFVGWKLLKGDPFRRSVMSASVTAAGALIVGPFVQLLLTGTATARALVELAGPVGQRADELLLTAELDLAPVLVGISLAIVLGVFELGQKLKTDTEGLV